jgi:hypothetical protein
VLHDPFNRARLPGDYSREGRVALIGEFFLAIREGREPSAEARMFVTSGALSWLESGGDLLRDYWKVKAPAGSHHTPTVLWSQASSRGATDQQQTETIGQSTSESTDQ